MELVNHTPIPADLRLAYLPHTPNRRGCLTAKATFTILGSQATLEREAPIEVFSEMQNHALGYIPQDVMVMNREPFEVMMLGEVLAAEGTTLTEQRVTLQVGDAERHLDVFGDRVWDMGTIGAPVPFERMPLTWERAFGGTAQIEIDEGAFLEVCEPMNPRGRGMDVRSYADAYATHLNTPAGFPRYDPVQRLPNVEVPGALIASPQDAPVPACWAPTPLDCGVRFGPAFDQIDRKNPLPLSPHAKRELIRSNLRHAHPDWWIPRPGRGARVRLSGVLENETLDFKLPALRVLGDYVVGSRSGTRELIPQAILLFANERRLCVTYRVSFLVRYEQGQERCFRLRTEEGWYAD